MGILCSIYAILICVTFIQKFNSGINGDLPVVFNFQGPGGIPVTFYYSRIQNCAVAWRTSLWYKTMYFL